MPVEGKQTELHAETKKKKKKKKKKSTFGGLPDKS